jgi:hypothetical protein
MPEAASRGLTRRQGLIGLALLGPVGVLTACTQGEDVAAEASTPAPITPGLVDEVSTDEAALIARYDVAIAAFPDAPVTATLSAIRDQHADHLAALGGSAAPASAPSPPASVAAAITDLIGAERAAAKARVDSCVAAGDPELARLLTMIGASEAAHVPALRELRS